MKPLASISRFLTARKHCDSRQSDQHGMTLVEMIISISMLTVITVPLTSAAMMFAQHGADVDKSLSDDTTVRSIEASFVADVQSATSVVLNDAAGCAGTTAAIATLQWGEPGLQIRTSWYAETIAGTLTMVRRRCSNGSLVSYERVGEVASAPTVVCAVTCTTDRLTSVTMTGTATNGAIFAFTGNRRSL